MSFDLTQIQQPPDIPNRIYFEYRDKPKAVQWFNITSEMAADLFTACGEVRSSYDIDFAEGELLNVIGRIVGIGREYTANLDLVVAQYGDGISGQFGDESAQFSVTNIDGDQDLSDEYYRKLIRWKIAVNNSDATLENTVAAINSAMPSSMPFVDDPEDMSFTIDFLGPISDIDRQILISTPVIPKPQGVRLNGFLDAAQVVLFGDDIDGQFGDESAQFYGITEVNY